jgi:amino acid adenylation domain-containing protein/non-ribosomal peptide synthase protein (TIGR01720 family)
MKLDAAPLSYAQQRLWLQVSLNPDDPAFHAYVALRARGHLDRHALQRSLDAIIDRHEVLRTTFRVLNGETLQVINPQMQVSIRAAGRIAADQLDEEMRRELRRPFDLARGSLLRGVIYDLDDRQAMLLLTVHHLVMDGWSMGVFLRELFTGYGALVSGVAPALPPLQFQYADFVDWERERLEEVEQGELEYWRERLRPPLRATEVLPDYPRPPVPGTHGATEHFRLDVLADARGLAGSRGASLFMVLLAAFEVVLQRHTLADEVVIGSPVAGRNHPDIEPLIGFFVNSLVLRTDFSGAPTFAEVLARVRETTLGAWDNQDIPFDRLVAVLKPERRPGRRQFFDLMFALQNAPLPEGDLPDLTVEAVSVVTDSAKFDMTVICQEMPDALDLQIEYNTELYEAATVRRLAASFEQVLRAACANPDARIATMPVVPPAELDELLRARRRRVQHAPAASTLHEWFALTAARYPDRIAVSWHGEELSYRALAERAECLAGALQSAGVRPRDRVAVAMTRCTDLVVGILGILKTGAAYVPLDPAYPTSRLAFMLADSRVSAVVTHAAATASLSSALATGPGLPVIRIEDIGKAGLPAAAGVAVAAADAAYVIYTSGSTGKPKGVVVTHENVTGLFAATAATFGFDANDVWTLFHSHAFDFSVWEMWGALLHGGRAVVVPHEVSRSPEALRELLDREGVTFLNQTPSAFAQFDAVDARVPGGLYPALRHVVFGGELLDPASLSGWFERHGDERPALTNMYGITETTVHVTHRRIRAADARPGASSVIGHAIDDLSLLVLDEHLQPVPIGTPGELFVGGRGVARGYLDRPGLTAERFVPDPFGADRLYRTGDRVRWALDGGLEFLGRLDTQVKVRGFRIELGEIQHVLNGAGLRESVVVPRDDDGATRLVAYGVAASPGACSPATLREACARVLPEYMVPAAYVLVDALPLTGNGKLDVAALPAPDFGHDTARETFVAPRTEIEKSIAAIWEEMLGVDRVSLHDNFFALGGDSIMMLQMAARISRAGFTVGRRDLIECQTVGDLAGRALRTPRRDGKEKRRKKGGATDAAASPADAVQTAGAEVEDEYALTPLQEGLLFHSLYAPEDGHYVEQLHGRLDGELDVPAFARAWQTVIDRHPVLRTSFHWRGVDRPVQRVVRKVKFELEFKDWRELAPSEQEARLADALDRDRARGFDFRQAPLMRVILLQLGPGGWYWIWTHHHLILDGWCLTLVVGEVLAAYDAYRRGAEPVLPERRPFRDFIDWLATQDRRAARDFWREHLRGFETPNRLDALERLAPGLVAASPRVGGTGERDLVLAPEETATLQEWARAQRVTLNTVVSACWARLLAVYSGSDDVVFGVTVSGRPAELEGFEHMVGLFINTLPSRVRLKPDQPLGDWLRDLQAQQAAMRAHEHTRLVDIQRESQLRAGESLFDALFVFENYPVDPANLQQLAGLALGPVTFVERTNYPLALAAIPGERLTLRVYHDRARFGDKVIERVLRELGVLLRATIAAPARDGSLLVGDWGVLPSSAEHDGIRALGEASRAPPESVATRPSAPAPVSAQMGSEEDAQSAIARQTAFWRKTLQQLPEQLDLPSDRPRPAMPSHRQDHVALRTTASLHGALAALARESEASLFMVLQAGLAALLTRLGAGTDVPIGSPVAGRTDSMPDDPIGAFVNILVLRTDTSGDPSFRELVARVSAGNRAAYDHRDLPFQRLVDVLVADRSPSWHPLFQVMLALQINTPDSHDVRRPTAGLEPIVPFSAKPDLSLVLGEHGGADGSPGGISGVLEYATDLFDRASVEAIAARLVRLLEAAVAEPDRAIGSLDILSAEERHTIVLGWNDTVRPLPPATLPELFAAQVARSPDAVAVVCEGESLTYADLDARANQLAHHLRDLGVGPETVVGLCVERSPGMLVGLLGIFKAGGAYLPLDPNYPNDRLTFMLDDAGAPVLVTHAALLDRLPPQDAHVVCLDADWPAIARRPTSAPAVSLDPQNAAYVIYTSGSTGTPKGVVVAHAGFANKLIALRDDFAVGSGFRSALVISSAFDAAIEQTVLPLVGGGAAVVVSNATREQPAQFWEQVIRDRVTFLSCVPSYLDLVLRQAPDALRLQHLALGGETFTTGFAREISRHLDVKRLTNLYGPTEATIDAVAFAVEGEQSGANIPIGRPLPNYRVYVLDSSLGPVLAGVVGELYIAGVGLARGYSGLAGLTAERFVANPYGPAGSRMYWTGDLARWRSDGLLEFVGRADAQLKIRGFRIEPGEIEAALMCFPPVAQAAVVARDDVAGHKRLAGYVVARDGQSVDPAALRAHLGRGLPDYMVPAAIVVLDRLPLTASGKLDRRALPAPDLAPAVMHAARMPQEDFLCGLFAKVLGLERVGINDNFFALGGDSILSLQIVSHALAAGMRISPRDLFEHPTVRELAARVGAAGVVDSGIEAAAGDVPLTPIQRWFFARGLRHRDRWNQSVILEIDPRVTPDMLQRALQAAAAEHDALRLRYVRTDGIAQRLAGRDTSADPMPCVVAAPPEDGPPSTPAAMERWVGRLADEAHSGLDLAHGPLARAVILLSPAEGVPSHLLLVAHHLVIDGVSWRILIEDVQQRLAEQLKGGAAEPLGSSVSFATWARRLSAYAATASLPVDYWLALGGLATPPLPVDRQAPAAANTAASLGTIDIVFDAATTASLLREVPGVYHTRAHEPLVAACAAALAEWTGARRVLLDLEGHGREALPGLDFDLSRTLGWFTSVYPASLEVPDGDPGATLCAVKEQLRQIPLSGVSFGVTVAFSEDEDLRRRLAQVPQPQITFNYLGQLDQGNDDAALLRLSNLASGSGQHADELRTHVLDIVAAVRRGELVTSFQFSTALHDRDTVARLAGGFERHLRALIDHCLRPGVGGHTPSDFPLSHVGAGPLAALERECAPIEDLHALSPMQQGLFFHAIAAPDRDLYLQQLHGELRGALDVGAFEQAWRETVQRHAIFRGRFVWKALAEPLFLVQPAAELEVTVMDWRALDPAQQDERIADLLRTDRRRGLALDRAPLMRITLVQRGDQVWHWLWTHHHALLDGWCVGLVLREVLDGYEARRSGKPAEPAYRRPYRDYIAWLQRQDGSRAGAFWRDELADFITPTRLALSAAPAAAAMDDAAAAGEAELSLSAGASARLEAWARANRLTLNTVLTGAWARLLASYSHSDDIVFGVTVAGRPAELEGADRMIGLFINTLPQRVRIRPGLPVVDWMRALQEQQLALREFDYCRLVDIQRASGLEPGVPLFETLIAFDNYPVDEALAQGFRDIEVIATRGVERTHYPLTLSVVPGRRLRMRSLFDRRRVGDTEVARILECLRDMLEAVCTGQVTSVDAWSLVAPSVPAPLPEAPTIAADDNLALRFARAAAAHPDRVAVSCGSRTLSYRELSRRAGRLAHHLREAGAGAESLVGLYLDRNVDIVVGILGILQAGAAYVPIDPRAPAERVGYMIADASLDLIVTESAMLDTLAPAARGSAAFVVLDRDAAQLAKYPPSAPGLEIPAASAAYVIYTSGSTGRPKGCVVAHGNVLRLFDSTRRTFAPAADDVWTLFHSVGFDFSVWEIWGALLHGGRLVIVPHDVSRSPERLHDMLQRERVTVLNQTPSAFRQLAAVDLARQRGKQPAPLALRHVIFGGEALLLEELRNWFERRGEEQPRLTNMYGITETTVHVTERRIRLIDVERASGSVIGEAIPDLRLSVLDPFGLPLPLGVPGELHVAGAGVARGYLRRAGLTAERFLPGPRGERRYRSGDLARRTGSETEYLGRIDQQVKVRGFRIELGEIEAALLDSPAVAMTIVQAVADAGDAQQRLAAYVVPSQQTSVEELREHLARKLPDYMIPAFFVLLDDLPLTVNGKVNRHALPSPDHAQRALATTFVAPRNDVERILAEAFATGLDLEHVGVHDNFFALGGDSIRSIQVLSLARAAGVDLDFGSLFSHPTVAQLAAAGSAAPPLHRQIGPFELVAPQVAGALPAGAEAAYPLTRLQQGMLLETLDAGATSTYHDVMSYHLQAPWNREALQVALAVMAERHDILRTSILLDVGPEPLQVVHCEATIPLAVDDLVALAVDEQERRIETWAREETARPLDLDRAPLLRAQVHLRSASTFQFSLSLHHAILDGWSLATLLTELFAVYAHRLGHAAPPLPAPPAVAFRDYVALERQVLADPGERSFWAGYVAGASPTLLPRQPSASRAGPRHRVQSFDIAIPAETSNRLERLATEMALPLRSVLLAAHVRALGVICGESEVVTGLVTNGRPEQQDGERVLGLFLGTLPFRLRFTGGSWRELVANVHDVEKQIERHRRFPLVEIQRLAGQALFETDFNFVHFHVFEQALRVHDKLQVLGAQGFEETGFTLAVNFAISIGRSIKGNLDLDMTAVAGEQGVRYAGVYGRVLERLANHPDERAGTADLLDPAEHGAMIAAGRARAAPAAACLHDLVGRQIARTPDAVAVIAGEQSLTFAGLDRRANQLAHVLIERGIRPDAVVAVCTSSCCDRVVALLAVLRAGAAYLLLESEQPRERLAAVLADAGVQVIVADDSTVGCEWPQRADVVVLRPDLIAGRPSTAPAVSVLPDNLAYVIFTSGSTGRPKGVQITHRGIASHMAWMRRRYPLVPGDRVLQKTPVSFDASVWEFWAPLVEGASLALVPDGSHRDAEFLACVMRNERISILQLVPTLLSALLDEPDLVQCGALRRLFVGGEPLSRELVLRAGKVRPGVEVVNLYGPAEATIDATSCALRAEHLVAAIGKPIDGMSAFVVEDAFQQIAPIGTDGNLYLGGAGLARGYAGRPGWTAGSFVPDALSGDAGARLYATGDRARWVRAAADTPELELEFRGRADDQVKLYGQRVELGEIDAALRSHPAVREAVTLLLDDGPRKRLVAHVVRAAEVELAGELRVHLADRLPRALIPNAFVFHYALPQSAGGKIDRRALIAASDDVGEQRRPYVAPQSEIERLLARIFAEVLGVERIGVSDDFYELGGDSILALQIVSRLRQAGWRLSPRRILEHPTVARVGAHAVSLGAGSKAASTRPAAGNVPLAPIQRDFFARLDAISEAGLEPGRPAHWNQSMLLTVPAGIEAGAVRRAVDAVAAIHDATRLRFRRTPAGWEQHYVPVGIPGGIEFESVDLSTAGNWQAELASRAEQAQAGLDLEQGPVGRAVYFSRGAERGRLLLVLHHLVVDVVSWRILLEDFAAAMAGGEVKLPPPSSPYSDWVAALEGRARSADAGPWLALSETQTPSLALGRLARAGLAQARHGVHADNVVKDAGAVRVRLDETSTAALLRDAPGRLRARPEELLVAALFESLSSADEASSLWLELEGHGREEVAEAESIGLDVSRTVGWFTALYPICLQRSVGIRGGELLRAVKRCLRPLSARGVDFGALLHLSPDPEVRAQLAALPRREVAFNFLGRLDAGRSADAAASTIDIQPAPEPAGHDHDPAGQRHYLLEVIARVSERELVIDWIYPSKIFSRATVELQAAEMVRSLKDLMVSDVVAAAAPSDFPLVQLKEDELDALLAAHPDTESVLPPSPLQEGLLFHALDDDQPGVYLQQITAELDGEVDRRAFEAAWDGALRRHDALRATFHRSERDGHAFSIVHRNARCPVKWLDWADMGPTEVEKRWRQLPREDRARGFLLDRPPMMRVHVVRVGDRAWRLLWSHHHLLLDGWSLPLVLGDVMTHYRALTEGAVRPATPAGSYADYLAWLSARNQTAAQARWREVLRGFDTPSPMLLPPAAVLSSPEAPEDTHGEVELVLPETVTRAISALARDNHLTLATIMQCWWAHLVARFSGRRDVVFGVTVSGRSAELPGIDTTVGLFINTLPLRVEVPAGCTLLGLAGRFELARATLTEHEDSRLVDVQRLADLPRGTQLFDSILIFQNYPLGEALAPLADFTVRDVEAIERTHYPLTCFVMPGRQLQVRLVYDATRFSREGVERVLEHGRRTLVATAESPMKPLEAVHTFPRRELELLVHAADGLERGHDRLSLHERIAGVAAGDPHRTAVVCGDDALSYRELVQRSNRLAWALNRHGIGAEDLVGICLERSADMLVALLGVLGSGAAYVPLDPRFPRPRLELMLADSAPRAVVTRRDLMAGLSAGAGPEPLLVELDDLADDPSHAAPPPVVIHPESLAYVIFTSGSTGRPKGVQVTHAALANVIDSFAARPGLTREDTFLAVTTLSFDIAALELFLPLTVGARLVIAGAEEAADAAELGELIEREHATVMQATPATWQMLVAAGWTGAPDLSVWSGGEALSADLAGELLARGRALWNLYGPTETTIWSKAGAVAAPRDARVLGPPIAATSTYVVDVELELTPPEVPGELLIAGRGLARGYRGQPGLTAERFVPDAFGSPGARAYRTGDDVRWTSAGLAFLGRLDQQVKIRGFRVELGEIEMALRAMPDVANAVATVRTGPSGHSRLVAYVVPTGSADASLRQRMQDGLRELLPAYILPSAYVFLAILPLTPNGKIDRRALPEPGDADGHDRATVAPRNEIEEAIAGLWEDALGIQRIGVTDSFFDLGGHSLVAASLLSTLRQVFKVRLPMRALFAGPTVEQMARAICELEERRARVQRIARAVVQLRAMSPEAKALLREQRLATSGAEAVREQRATES